MTCLRLLTCMYERAGFKLRPVLFQVRCFFCIARPEVGPKIKVGWPVNYVTVSYDWGERMGRLLMLFLQYIRRAPGVGRGDSMGSTVRQGKRQLLKLKVAGYFGGIPRGSNRAVWSLCFQKASSATFV